MRQFKIGRLREFVRFGGIILKCGYYIPGHVDGISHPLSLNCINAKIAGKDDPGAWGKNTSSDIQPRRSIEPDLAVVFRGKIDQQSRCWTGGGRGQIHIDITIPIQAVVQHHQSHPDPVHICLGKFS